MSFTRCAWALVVYNLAVVAWGAFVRATGSGAGCGEHWPLCNGEVIPRAPAVETLIELSHRLSTGLDGIFVLAIFFWARRIYAKGDPPRRWASWTLFLILVEGAVGAALVKLGLVAENDSTARAVVMGIHLCTTFALLAAMMLMAWTASGQSAQRPRNPWVWIAVLACLILGVSGAVTALGDTLFPVSSFREGWEQDFSPSAHLFIRLRIFHPAIAVITGLGLMALGLRARERGDPLRSQLGSALIGLVVLQLAMGSLNVLLAAPVWLQLLHLLLADLIWLVLIVLAVSPSWADEPEALPA